MLRHINNSILTLLAASMLALQLPTAVLAMDSVTVSASGGGTPAIGDALIAEATNLSGEAAYQWYADDVAVSGAVNSEFTPTYEQFGKKIKCKVTDNGGEKYSNEVSLVSDFDEYKDTSWGSMATVPIGTEPLGKGNSDWNFEMKNTYGKKLSYTLLDVKNDKKSKYYVLANDYYGIMGNETTLATNVYNPELSGSVAYKINNSLSGKQGKEFDLPNAIVDAIDNDHVWVTEKDKAITAPYTVKAGVTVPAIWEINKYISKIKLDVRKTAEIPGKLPMWFRTSYNAKNAHGLSVDPDGNGVVTEDLVIFSTYLNNYYFKLVSIGVSNGTGYIRPQFFLNEDFFKYAKVDLSTAGKEVLAEISKVSYKDLSNLYADDDIETYLPTVEGAGQGFSVKVKTADGGDPIVGNTIVADVKNAQDTVYFQWYADGEPIEGANSETFPITYNQLDKVITCTITYGDVVKKSDEFKVTSVFDKHKNLTWDNYVAITLGEKETGHGDPDWEFQMKNAFGKTLSFSLLDVANNKNSKFYILANDYYGLTTNYTIPNPEIVDAVYNPEMEGTMGYAVNNNLQKKDGSENTLPLEMVEAIDTEHIWITEKDSTGYITAPFTVKAGVTVPAIWEMREYIDRIKVDIRKSTEIGNKNTAWLRTALKYNHYQSVNIDPDGDGDATEDLIMLSGQTNNYYFKVAPIHITNAGNTGYIRPQFFLNEDFFLNVKLDLATTGKKVIETLGKEYTREQLLNVYTEDELESAGLGTNYDLSTVWKSGDASITSLDGVTTLSAELSLENKLSKDKNCIVIMALYDESGEIVKMKGTSVTMKANEITAVPKMTIDGLTDVTDDFQAQIYVLDNLYDMKLMSGVDSI